MFQIHWRAIKTGATGHGTGVFPKEQAEKIVEELNRENKGLLVHWSAQQTLAPDAVPAENTAQ